MPSPLLQTIGIPCELTGSTRLLAYTEWGDPKNPKVLVCVHGLTRNSRDFDIIAQSLANDYRVICLDVVGRGRSEWFENGDHYNYQTYVADALKFLNALGLKQVHWLGTSMGGLIGMMISAFQPGIITKMVMNDIGPFIPGNALKRISSYITIYPKFADMPQGERYLRNILSPFGIVQDEHWQHMANYSIKQHGEGHYTLSYDRKIAKVIVNADHQAGVEPQDMDMWPVWTQVNIPVLIVRGAQSDLFLAETAQQMLIRDYPTKLIEFPEAGHAPALMEPHQIEPVKAWLLHE